MVIDPTEIVSRFVQYRDVNLLNALNSEHMKPEKIRLALLGALRYVLRAYIFMNNILMIK